MEYQNFPGKTSPASALEIGVPVSSNSGPAPYYSEKAHEPVGAHVHQKDKTSDEAQWSTGLCDCFSNPTNCCITCWCPCITFGQVAEIVDKGYPSCGVSGALYALIAYITGCTCFYSCVYRSKMRKQYSLHGSACNDCLVHCFCECCALCQEYRELEHRGFDMSIGWHGNVERQSRGVVMAPVVEQGMKK